MEVVSFYYKIAIYIRNNDHFQLHFICLKCIVFIEMNGLLFQFYNKEKFTVFTVNWLSKKPWKFWTVCSMVLQLQKLRFRKSKSFSDETQLLAMIVLELLVWIVVRKPNSFIEANWTRNKYEPFKSTQYSICELLWIYLTNVFSNLHAIGGGKFWNNWHFNIQLRPSVIGDAI